MCNKFNNVYIVFFTNDGLQITKIGTSFYGPKGKTTTYEFWFDGKKIQRSVIRNFLDEKENDLGDLLPSTRNFVTLGAYIDSRFKKEFEGASTNWQVVVGGSPIRGRNGESPWPRVMRTLIARWDAKR